MKTRVIGIIPISTYIKQGVPPEIIEYFAAKAIEEYGIPLNVYYPLTTGMINTIRRSNFAPLEDYIKSSVYDVLNRTFHIERVEEVKAEKGALVLELIEYTEVENLRRKDAKVS